MFVSRADRIVVKLPHAARLSGFFARNLAKAADDRRPIRSRAPGDWPHRIEARGIVR